MTSTAAARFTKTVEKMRAAAKTSGRRSSKHQAPNPKEAPSTKLQDRLRTTLLGFGIWSFRRLWRCGRRCCRSAAERREVYGWRFLGARRGGEKRPGLEAKHLVQHVGWETFQRGVVLLHRGIEIVSFDRDPILGSFQLHLQILKRLRGLELRIIFAHHQQPRQRGAELSLGFLEFLQLRRIRRRLARIEFYLAHACPRVRYFRERGLFEIRCAGHGADQVRYEISPPLLNRLPLYHLVF